LYHITNGEILITSAVYDGTNTYTVYKLDIEPNDVFFANGILTHNRKGEAGLCPTVNFRERYNAYMSRCMKYTGDERGCDMCFNVGGMK